MIFKGGSGCVVTEGGGATDLADGRLRHKQDLLRNSKGAKDFLREIKRICLRRNKGSCFRDI